MRRLALATFVLLASCKRAEQPPPPTPAPTPVAAPTADRSKLPAAWKDASDVLPDTWVASLAFIDTMLVEHEGTAEKVTCHCCKKSLAQCFRETRDRVQGSCPPL